MWAKWPVSQYFYITLPICVPKNLRVMTTSTPPRHTKKRLIKTVGAHTLCSCGYMQDGGLYFYIKDYQGNVRVVLNQANHPVEVDSYYPYGGLMAATTTEGTQPYKYSTKELDRENGLDLYDSKARMYDPTIGRTPTQDPMAEKYYSKSPYLWCAGNPITFADPNGKEVDVIWLLRIDQSCNTNYSQQFISELNSITGLSLYIDKEGKLKYNIKETGEVEIKATNKGQGSQTARNHLKSLIDNKETVTVEGGKDSCTRRNTVALNLRQIASFVNGSNNVSNLTLGLGMVFLHESFHTEAGGGLHDDGSPFCTGSVVDKMNTIRDEMNKNGYDFGKRMSYPSILLPNGQNVIPFDNKSFELLRQGFPPTPSSKFISF